MRHALLALLVLLVSCAPTGKPNVTVIVGATMIDGKGGPPLKHSVVVVEGSKIRAAGPQASVRIPPGSEKIDGAGQYVAPRERSGTIEPGKLAELVLISGEKVVKTMSYGQWVEYQ